MIHIGFIKLVLSCLVQEYLGALTILFEVDVLEKSWLTQRNILASEPLFDCLLHSCAALVSWRSFPDTPRESLADPFAA